MRWVVGKDVVRECVVRRGVMRGCVMRGYERGGIIIDLAQGGYLQKRDGEWSGGAGSLGCCCGQKRQSRGRRWRKGSG